MRRGARCDLKAAYNSYGSPPGRFQRGLGDGGEDAVGGERGHAVGALSLACRRRGEPLWRGREEGGLGGGVGGADS